MGEVAHRRRSTSVTVVDPGQLVDQAFGPKPLGVAVDKVADFVNVTGDDPEHWADEAPPGFASAALFVVAPDLLSQLVERSVIHGEQTFTWHRPINIGEVLEVTGTVTRARERGGVHFLGFDLRAESGDRTVLDGSSLFVVSGRAIPGSGEYERPEPPQAYKGELEPGQVAASRADLVRYAAATRDWNPIHWDHDAAVAAGLPGVVVHGLFQSAWAFGAVTRQIHPSRRLASAKVRFRSPLLPARPVTLDLEQDGSRFDVTISDEAETYMTARIETSDE